jgi:C_GCAxxG_C_C family probable redox protein
MGTREDIALGTYADKFNCAQSVLSAFCRDCGLEPDTAMKLACGFGGGGMKYEQTCGAVSGAIMVVGLKIGQYIKGDLESKKLCYQKVHEFSEAFKAEKGTIVCRELLGVDKNTEIDQTNETMRRIFSTVCPEYIKCAVRILEGMNFE